MIWLILVAAFFLRVYRVTDFLGFWFDQGRDALAIWDLWHKGNFFLIGPTTGIEGIFLGPFYYYFIAPWYLLGNGNPVVPAVFLAALNTGTIYLIYRLVKKYISHTAGLIAAGLYALSFQFISAHRWLSNPTPLPFFAVIAMWLVLELIHASKIWWYWPILGLVVGLGLQLEAASATFFLPAIALIFLIYRKTIQAKWVNWFSLAGAFGFTLLPQLFFNFRNGNILLHAFERFLIGEKSFQPAIIGFLTTRLQFYYQILTNKFSHDPFFSLVFVISLLFFGWWTWKKFAGRFATLLLIWMLTPVIILLFYHGNKGYVWDYYFTGIYPAVCMLVGSVYWLMWSTTKNWLRWLPIVLLLAMLYQNAQAFYAHYVKNSIAPFISLSQIKQAVGWVYQDAENEAFNYDVYVPPVLYEAYKYVFQWLGTTTYHRQPTEELVRRFYTLHEPDQEHQVLLNTWMTRQASLGSIDYRKTFGLIDVERRVRFSVSER